MSGHQSLHHTPQPLEFSFAHAALHCGQSERATSRASRACSSSLILRSSEQLPQAVRADQCRTKEGCYPEPRKRPELVLDAQGRHYATKEGHDARRHKQPEIVKRARSNGALHQSALHCGQSERAALTVAALCGLSASGEVVVKRASSRYGVTPLRRFYTESVRTRRLFHSPSASLNRSVSLSYMKSGTCSAASLRNLDSSSGRPGLKPLTSCSCRSVAVPVQVPPRSDTNREQSSTSLLRGSKPPSAPKTRRACSLK